LHLVKSPFGLAPLFVLDRRATSTHRLKGFMRVLEHVSSS
jgi:hypothetical protein